MERAITEWIDGTTSLRLPYTVYGCMLLLSPNAFQTPSWQAYQRSNPGPDFERLYKLICHHLKVSHIAINKPIPVLQQDQSNENVVRSPDNFVPLYGDFGPDSATSRPAAGDFDAAFWVTAKQNGIFQTWAPRWTMFSRGNIGEKARLLSLPSVKEAVEQGCLDGRGCTAIDLYAGIGYFAFSYLKAGVEKVLCWDLNAWSIEGLKRGATANKWSVVTLSCDGIVEDLVGSNARVLVFNESNVVAADRISAIGSRIPPVRHVNCGLLPTSRGSWQMAVEVLDHDLGGWVHVHENFAVEEIEQKAEEVRLSFQEMALWNAMTGTVKIECVNRLKSYAPGVMHCVIDVYIPPSIPNQ